MGGDITVESKPGAGSTFRVSLMLSSVYQPMQAQEIPDIPPSRQREAQGKRIVQVDDEAQHRHLMRAFLEPLGVDLIDVDNALHALQIIRREQPDLVLLDVSMPGLSGWEVLQQLRAAQLTMPVLMISADASEGRQQPDSPIMHNGYIIKPVRLPELMDTLGKLLQLEWTPDIRSPRQRTRIESLDLPADVHTKRLIELAAIGHRRGLIEEIHRLAHQGLASESFVAHVTTLINEFQFDRLTTLLRDNAHA